MEVTGSAIRTDKSRWCLVDYVWRKGKWLCTDRNLDLDLIATGSDRKVVSVEGQDVMKQLKC